jgi:hypothetical protein
MSKPPPCHAERDTPDSGEETETLAIYVVLPKLPAAATRV